MSCVSNALGLPKCDYCEFKDLCSIRTIIDEDTSDPCYGCEGKERPIINGAPDTQYKFKPRWLTK